MKRVIKVSRNENIVFILTKEDILACAMELGIAEEQINKDIIESARTRIRLELCHWPEIFKAALREAIRYPLELDCYPSRAWWQGGKCAFSKQGKNEIKEEEEK